MVEWLCKQLKINAFFDFVYEDDQADMKDGKLKHTEQTYYEGLFKSASFLEFINYLLFVIKRLWKIP